MIGFFDSGKGGFITMQYFQQLHPQYNYTLYADNLNNPYGTKTPEEIKDLTFKGLNSLFDMGAKMVIIACNTAAAHAAREWQNTYPDKKVLSVTIPGIEQMINKWYKNITVLATQSTKDSGIYQELTQRFAKGKWIKINTITAQDLVKLIEFDINNVNKIKECLVKYSEIMDDETDAIILWCTHYSRIKDYAENVFQKPIIDPSMESAKKIWEYLKNHPEIEDELWLEGELKIITTDKDMKY